MSGSNSSHPLDRAYPLRKKPTQTYSNASNPPSGPSSALSSTLPQSSSHHSNGLPAYKEFRIKSSIYHPGTSHHVMIMPEVGFSFNELVPPIKLNRKLLDGPERSLGVKFQGAMADPAKAGLSNVSVASLSGEKLDADMLPARGRPFRKKTHIIIHSDADQYEENKRLKEMESKPWVLEDSDTRLLQGKLEGGQSQKYVLFVNRGNDIRVILINKWYKFTPRIQYHTLSLEEAEKKISEKRGISAGTSSDRWMMLQQANHRPESSSKTATKVKLLRQNMLKVRLEDDESNMVNPLKAAKETEHEGFEDEEMDYEEVFDDDEYDVNVEEEPSEFSSKKKPDYTGDEKQSSTLNKAGKELKKTLKHIDKSIQFDGSEDEEKDPYAFSDEEDQNSLDSLTESEEDFQQSRDTGKKSAGKRLASIDSLFNPVLPSSTKSRGIAARGASSPRRLPNNAAGLEDGHATSSKDALDSKNIKKLKMSPPSAPLAAVGSSGPESDVPKGLLLTEEEIIFHLKRQSLRTKDLIHLIKGKLKAHPINKDRFKLFVKKLATVKSGPSEEDRLLELKEEYR